MTSFNNLKKFITKEMRMSQIYQPVMLITLLKNKGIASIKQVAQSILDEDPTQLDYYSDYVKKRLKNMR